ncbi:hypothetical protein [Streptomyces sp. TLI_105]|uniref:hypothetical protein n=1 Tax=Streptomyces sp. TLI_105 TaxID=1881019 RepID=UPI00089B7440|nr:hypothetical protein [Streptomyces sp. TLI_105]SEC41792.1 hypothetical protein SAMN05428939_2326 [Streptomyces sp. TLI_105]
MPTTLTAATDNGVDQQVQPLSTPSAPFAPPPVLRPTTIGPSGALGPQAFVAPAAGLAHSRAAAEKRG